MSKASPFPIPLVLAALAGGGMLGGSPAVAQPVPTTSPAELGDSVSFGVDPELVSTAAPAIVATADGFLVAWERQREEQPHLHPPTAAGEAIAIRGLSRTGELVGAPREVHRVPSPERVVEPQLAIDGRGREIVAWAAIPEKGHCIEWVVPEASPVIGDEALCGVAGIAPFGVVGRATGYTIAWPDPEIVFTGPITFHTEYVPSALDLGPTGARQDPPEALGEQNLLPGIDVAAAAEGQLVAWVHPGDEPTAPTAVISGAYRTATGAAEPFEILEAVTAYPAAQVEAPVVVRAGALAALVVWTEPGAGAFRFRRIGAEGPLGAPGRIAAPDGVFLARPAVAVGPDGSFAIAWRQFDTSTEEQSCRLGLFAPTGDPLGEEHLLDTGCLDPAVAWSGDAVAAVWTGDAYERFHEVRGRLFPVEGAAPSPPAGPGATSPDLPGFRFWVRLSDGAGSRIGTETSPCLAEAVCFAGALPDRAEVVVRVVGPKPNGFLWPTIVKLSTAEVEVWVEQEATGVVRYYRLEGAAPGFDVLPGLFDRNGFPAF